MAVQLERQIMILHLEAVVNLMLWWVSVQPWSIARCLAPSLPQSLLRPVSTEPRHRCARQGGSCSLDLGLHRTPEFAAGHLRGS